MAPMPHVPPEPRPPHDDPSPTGLPRRAFFERGLRIGAVLAAGPMVAPEVAAQAAAPDATASTAPATPASPRPDAVPSGRPLGEPFTTYGQPSAHEANVLRSIGLNGRDQPGNGAAWTPLEQLEGTLTPNGLHFVRNHHGTPAIDPAQHRLVIHGQVQRPLSFSADALLRYPQQSRQLVIECGGNSNPGWYEEPYQRPVGLIHGLVSCAEWTGVPLATLLDECGVQAQATWIVAGGADAAAMQISVPLDKARHDCFVALFQNGERLRPENGYPMRLIVPGWKGVLHVKWLSTLQLADQPAMSRYETARYTELLPSGLAQQFTVEVGVKSVITTPSHGQRLNGPDVYEIRGLAWSGRGAIRQVEVSADGGRHWELAALQGPVRPMCWTRFRAAWRWRGEPALLQSRATDDAGQVQPTREALVAARGRRSFYHYNAITSWAVTARGAVLHSYGEE